MIWTRCTFSLQIIYAVMQAVVQSFVPKLDFILQATDHTRHEDYYFQKSNG